MALKTFEFHFFTALGFQLDRRVLNTETLLEGFFNTV